MYESSFDLACHRVARLYRDIDRHLDARDRLGFTCRCRELRVWLSRVHDTVDEISMADAAAPARRHSAT